MIKITNIIFGLSLLIFLTYSNSLKFSNNFINKSRLNMNSFEYNYQDHSNFFEMELFNWKFTDEGFYDIIDFNKFYYIIGNKNANFYELIDEMKNRDICCIFIPISAYKLNDIDSIFLNLLNKKFNDLIELNFNNIEKSNNFLIFDQNKYIGGLFEIYSILYKNT
jgi:hypothetical protein